MRALHVRVLTLEPPCAPQVCEAHQQRGSAVVSIVARQQPCPRYAPPLTPLGTRACDSRSLRLPCVRVVVLPGLTAIAANLRINTTLSSINLFGNKIGDAGLAVLAPALRDNRTVSSLSLGDNSLTNAWCVPCLVFVCMPNRRLRAACF